MSNLMKFGQNFVSAIVRGMVLIKGRNWWTTDATCPVFAFSLVGGPYIKYTEYTISDGQLIVSWKNFDDNNNFSPSRVVRSCVRHRLALQARSPL